MIPGLGKVRPHTPCNAARKKEDKILPAVDKI